MATQQAYDHLAVARERMLARAMTAPVRQEKRRGRGAISNASGRFEPLAREAFDDGWAEREDQRERIGTQVISETARRIITRNTSPDIPFDRSINPYRGCEHGCTYCFARPTHTFMGLSAGLDFETKLFAKENAAELLEKELSNPRYTVAPIAIGTNTDAYQPIEKEKRIMRRCLEVLSAFNHPVTILTKSHMVTRDLDLIAPMAAKGLIKVGLSVTSLDPKLSRAMEPRAASPQRRLTALKMLADAGVPTAVMMAPVIPALNDPEMETILRAARDAGATEAGFILLRLPMEVAPIFSEWLHATFPDRAPRVMRHLREARNGKLNDPRFKARMRGTGAYAEMISQRFRLTAARLGFNKGLSAPRTDLFAPPLDRGDQMDLFA